MSKYLYKFFLVIVFLFIVVLPNNVEALSLTYMSENDNGFSVNDEEQGLYLANMKLEDLAFSSYVYNYNDYPKEVVIEISYFDSNFNFVTNTYEQIYLDSDEFYTYKSELSELDDVTFYKFTINSTIVESSSPVSNSYSAYIIAVFSISCVFIVLFFCIFPGKNKKAFKKVFNLKFKDYNVFEVGYIDKNYNKNIDVVALLYDLAKRGYIKIECSSKLNEFKIIQIKDYRENNKLDLKLLENIFKSAKYVPGKSYNELHASSEQLKDDLDYSLKDLNQILKQTDLKDVIYTYKSMKLKKILPLLVILIYILISLVPGIKYRVLPIVFPGFLVCGFCAFVLLLTFSDSFRFVNNRSKITLTLLIVVPALIIAVVFFYVLVYPVLILDNSYLYAYIIGIVCILLLLRLSKYVLKKSDHGDELDKEIKELKNDIVNIDINTLNNHDDISKVFFELLPYALIFNLEKELFDKFKYSAVKEPEWLSFQEVKDANTFYNSYQDLNKALLEMLNSDINK